MLFMTFHGTERFEPHAEGHDSGHHGAAHEHSAHGDAQHRDAQPDHAAHDGLPRESPWVVTVPLILLAIPSCFAGWAYVEPLLYGGFFNGAIFVAPEHDVLTKLGEEFHGPAAFALHAVTSLPFWLAVAGIATSWYLYLKRPELPGKIAASLRGLYTVLENKYYFDRVYQTVFAGGARLIGTGLWKIGDMKIIDGFFVNGTGRVIGWASTVIRRFQSGYIYHYAFMMIIGVFVLLTLWFARA
jgi:NADH-quinone oxidoreductase subunit L